MNNRKEGGHLLDTGPIQELEWLNNGNAHHVHDVATTTSHKVLEDARSQVDNYLPVQGDGAAVIRGEQKRL